MKGDFRLSEKNNFQNLSFSLHLEMAPTQQAKRDKKKNISIPPILAMTPRVYLLIYQKYISAADA